MTMLERAKQFLGFKVTVEPKPLPEPEPAYAQPRPMLGLLALLSPDQRKVALAYRGPVCLGDAAAGFAKKA